MWILSLVVGVFGPSVVALRMTTVVIGSLACVAFFGATLAVESRRGRGFALCAAFVLCTLHWHSHFSRLVFTTNLVPLVACGLVWTMAVAARVKDNAIQRKGAWAVVGVLAGLGFYTYYSWYFFLPVIAVWFWALRPDDEGAVGGETGECASNGSWRGDLLYLSAGAGLAILPLLIHYILSPSDLTRRLEALSLFSNGFTEGMRAVAGNLCDVVLMFFVRGDHVIKHNVAVQLAQSDPLYGKTGSPVFEPIWALLFVVGLVRAIVDCRSGGAQGRRSAAWLAWLICMSMPSVLSFTESANSLRNLGATPAVAWFVALGWWWCYQAVARHYRAARRQWVHIALFVALVWGAAFQIYKAWILHPKVPELAREFSSLQINVARFCAPDPKGGVYFVPMSFYGHKTFEFFTLGRDDIRPLNPVELLSRPEKGPARDHLVLCTTLSSNYEMLCRHFPRGTVEKNALVVRRLGEGPFAWIFRIPASDLVSRREAEREAPSVQLIPEQ